MGHAKTIISHYAAGQCHNRVRATATAGAGYKMTLVGTEYKKDITCMKCAEESYRSARNNVIQQCKNVCHTCANQKYSNKAFEGHASFDLCLGTQQGGEAGYPGSSGGSAIPRECHAGQPVQVSDTGGVAGIH